MNANELADKLKKGLELGINSNLYILDAVTMLRQLQAENEALKAYKEAYKILWDERNERK